MEQHDKWTVDKNCSYWSIHLWNAVVGEDAALKIRGFVCTPEKIEQAFSAFDGVEVNKDYDGKQDVRAWLFTVARNAYYDHCRRAKHAAPLEDAETKAADSPDIAQLLVDKDAAFTVHQCLHALEEPYKEVFSLRVFGELPFDRIGAIFGHNAAWARVTYYRAKTRIQTMLEQRK